MRLQIQAVRVWSPEGLGIVLPRRWRGGLFPREAVCCQAAVRASVCAWAWGPGGGSHRHLGGSRGFRGNPPPADPSLWPHSCHSGTAPPHSLTSGRRPPGGTPPLSINPQAGQVPHALRATPQRTPPRLPDTAKCAWISMRASMPEPQQGCGPSAPGGVACSRRPLSPPVPPPKFCAAAACPARGVTRRLDRHRLDRLPAWVAWRLSSLPPPAPTGIAETANDLPPCSSGSGLQFPDTPPPAYRRRSLPAP